MKSLMTKHLIICIFLISTLFSCQSELPPPSGIKEAVDKVVMPYIALGSNVGIIVGVIKNGEKSIYSFGEKELGKKEKITGQSVLEIASLTKTYTAIALLDMHLKGDLNLDDPIEKYLPNTVKIPSFNGKKITLRHLANHTSGFPRDPENIDKNAYNKYDGYTEEKMYDFVSSYSLTREPGTQVEYSNVGYGLLGQILSLKNKSNYEAMITNRVLQPLGLNHTSVSFTPEQTKNLVQGYNGNKPVESWSKYMQNIMQGTGSLISSIDDQLLYLEANLGQKKTFLDNAIALSHTQTISYSSLFYKGVGLGWGLYTATDGQNIIWKNGGNGGYTSFMGFNKTTQTGVIVLTNSTLNPDFFQTTIGFQILEELNKF